MDEHLPPLYSTLYSSDNLQKNYALKMANDYVVKTVGPKKIERLTKLTTRQSHSTQWFRHRAGRITASKLRPVVHTNVHQPSLSLLTTICYPDVTRFTTEATRWGCTHEPEAVQAYENENESVHDSLVIEQSGFYVSSCKPFLGASPDGLVVCTVCGPGSLEVECSYSCREQDSATPAALSLEEMVDSSSFCLKKKSDGSVMLDKGHQYYYQCQLQMFVTGRRYCDFVVWSEQQTQVASVSLQINHFLNIQFLLLINSGECVCFQN